MIIHGNLDPEKFDYKCFPDTNEENSLICVGFPKKNKKSDTPREDKANKRQREGIVEDVDGTRAIPLPYGAYNEYGTLRQPTCNPP